MTNPQEEVSITALAAGGAGVGKLSDGRVIFVQGAYPGDVARVRVEKLKKRHAGGTVVTILSPSPHRRQAECPHVQECGGCPWMELDPAEQLAWKKTIVEQAIARIGRAQTGVDAVTPSPIQLGYRHRVRLKGVAHNGEFSFAYRRRGSHGLAPIRSCAVAHDKINQVMAQLSRFLSARPTLAASVDEALIETDGERCRALFFPCGQISRAALESMIGLVEGLDGAGTLESGEVRSYLGEEYLHIHSSGAPVMLLAPGAFAQANLALNPALVRRVMEISGLAGGGSGLDLFCGAGNYSIPLALGGAHIQGVDLSTQAIVSAVHSADANSLVNATFHTGDCLEAVMEYQKSGSKFDVVILNPPRAGAGETFRKALDLAEHAVVYASCDPAPLARDSLHAMEQGFSLKRLELFDMFPHTPHMETLALFERTQGQ